MTKKYGVHQDCEIDKEITIDDRKQLKNKKRLVTKPLCKSALQDTTAHR